MKTMLLIILFLIVIELALIARDARRIRKHLKRLNAVPTGKITKT